MVTIEQIIRKLKLSHLRVTKSRLAVSKVMLKNRGLFLTTEEIHQELIKVRGQKCDLVSVYRILSTFEGLGIVKKTEFQAEAARYGLVSSLGAEHHYHEHFFKCTNCLTIEPFDDCFFSKKEKQLRASGYKNISHHVEITGLCPSCA
jgi:Fe2+ or Zn2+ uptake regulation protein